MKLIMSRQKSQLMYVLTVGILYFILCYLAPVILSSDDLLYKFVWPYDNESFSRPISSIGSVIESQYIHYKVLNGRSIIHFFVQLFDGIIGKEVCSVISAILFGCLIFMTTNLVSQGKNTLLGLTVVSAMLFLLLPGFHNAFLFFVGQFNYLWATVATLFFIFMLNNVKEKQMSVRLFCLSMSSFFFGWLHEGIGFPITLTLIVYCLCDWRKQKTLKSPVLYFTFFYALGTFVCLFSPGTMQRIGMQESLLQAIIQKLVLFGVNLLHLRISYLMLAVSLFYFCKKSETWKEHFGKFKYYYLAWFFSFIPIAGSGVTETRVLFYAEFIAMIIVSGLLLNNNGWKYKRSITIGTNAVMLLMYTVVLCYTLENYTNDKFILKQLKDPKVEMVSVPQIRPASNPVLLSIFDNYVREPFRFGPFEFFQGFVQDNAHVKCLKILFGKDKLYMLPKDIVEKIKSNKIRKDVFTYNAYKELMVLEVKADSQIKEVKFLLNDEDINLLPFYKRLLAYRSNSYTVPEGYYDTMVYNNKKYLIVCCPTNNILRRIKDIVYT